MEQQDNLAADIDYFHGQAEISPFAAQVAKWLTELQHARQKATNASTLKYRGLAMGFGSDGGMSSLMVSQ